MFSFQPEKYGPRVSQLLDPDRLCELGPGQPVEAARPILRKMTTDQLFATHPVADADMASGCLSALWLWHDFLDESHSLSQQIPSPSGSYWHGIMHRREPDDSNAKYWFRRVGDHPILPSLREAAVELGRTTAPKSILDRILESAEWDSLGFVDLCAAGRRQRGALETLCRQVARVEWQLLFDFCWDRAISDR